MAGGAASSNSVRPNVCERMACDACGDADPEWKRFVLMPTEEMENNEKDEVNGVEHDMEKEALRTDGERLQEASAQERRAVVSTLCCGERS